MFGVEPFLLGTVDNPDETVRALHRLKELSALFGQAQLDAGADALTFPDHAAGDLVSGEDYRRFLQDLPAEMAERRPAPLILPICGRTIDRMPAIAQTGMAAFHCDSKNDPQEAMQAVNGGPGLVGNSNNPSTLYARGPEEVRQEVFRCLEAGVQLMGSECAVPLAAKLENLMAIPQAVKEWTAAQS